LQPNLDYISVCAGWQEQRIKLTNSGYIPTSFIPGWISDQFDSGHTNLGSLSRRYLSRNLPGNISGWNLYSISLARYMLASRWYGFVELKLSTPKVLHIIGVLVTVANRSACDEGRVVSTGCMLDVGEGPCILLLEYVLQQRKSLKK